jgi:hypothetical protein
MVRREMFEACWRFTQATTFVIGRFGFPMSPKDRAPFLDE